MKNLRNNSLSFLAPLRGSSGNSSRIPFRTKPRLYREQEISWFFLCCDFRSCFHWSSDPWEKSRGPVGTNVKRVDAYSCCDLYGEPRIYSLPRRRNGVTLLFVHLAREKIRPQLMILPCRESQYQRFWSIMNPCKENECFQSGLVKRGNTLLKTIFPRPIAAASFMSSKVMKASLPVWSTKFVFKSQNDIRRLLWSMLSGWLSLLRFFSRVFCLGDWMQVALEMTVKKILI